MKREIISSSIIDSIGYDKEKQILEIELSETKEVRQYMDVPQQVWNDFYGSASRGKYFLKNIKDKYRKAES